MRITHLAASNWRNFKNVEFDIGDRLFIVGPNAAGKSNLLDIFASCQTWPARKADLPVRSRTAGA